MTVTVNYAPGMQTNSHTFQTSPTEGQSFPDSTYILSVSNNLGRQLSFADDGTVSDGNGRSMRKPLPGQLTTNWHTTDPAGHVTGFVFNAFATPMSRTQRPVPYINLFEVHTPDDPDDANTRYVYDGLGQVAQVFDAEAGQNDDRAPYNFLIGDGAIGERDDPLGGRYTVVYDTYNHPSRYSDELGNVTLATIDSRDRPVSYIFPEGDCEGFAYDDHNNTTAYTRVDKTGACNVNQSGSHRIQVRATWDQTWNKPLTITTANGNVTHFVYNTAGTAGASLLNNATRPADPDGNVGKYQFTYDSQGKVTEADVPFMPDNNHGTGQWIVTRNHYDPVTENLTSTVLDPDHLAITTAYTYDGVGNVATTTDPRGNVNVTEDTYNADRNKTESHHHDGGSGAALNSASRTTYDALERDIKEESGLTFSGVTVSTWQTDKTTTYTPTSKVASVTDADGSVTANTYDALDRTDVVTDPVGRRTHFTYDARSETLVEYRAWQAALQQAYATYTYGNDGEKLTEKDANTNVTNYAYDGFNRLGTTTFPDSTTEILAYDKDSNIVTRNTRANQQLVYLYDTLDRMKEKQTLATPGGTELLDTLWQYYLNGTVSVLTDSNGNDLYTLNNGSNVYYDTAGRLVRTDTTIPGIASVLTTSYTLDPSGNRTALIWPDAYCAAYSFDSLNRMSTVKKGTASAGVCTSSTTLATYGYDTLSRRTSLAYPAASVAYGYSPAGDLTSLAHTITGTGDVPHYTLGFTAAHQLASEVSSDPNYALQLATTGTDTYTPANNLNQYPSWSPGGGASQAFTYDLNGNMTGGTINGSAWTFGYDPENRLLTANKSGGAVQASYAYDPLGRRTHKSGTGVTETYFLDDGTDEIAEYSSAGALTVHYLPGPAINEPVASLTGSVYHYLQTDHHGSVIATVSQAGNEADGPFAYDAYGNCRSGANTCAPRRHAVSLRRHAIRLRDGALLRPGAVLLTCARQVHAG